MCRFTLSLVVFLATLAGSLEPAVAKRFKLKLPPIKAGRIKLHSDSTPESGDTKAVQEAPRVGASVLGASLLEVQEATQAPVAVPRARGARKVSSASSVKLSRKDRSSHPAPVVAPRHVPEPVPMVPLAMMTVAGLPLQLLNIALYTLLCVICFGSALALRLSKSSTKGSMMQCLRDSLEQTYTGIVVEAEQGLLEVLASPACQAEDSLEHLRHDFLRFLARVRAAPASFMGPHSFAEFLPHFLVFVKHWLSVYDQWSLEPLQRADEAIDMSTYDSCTSLEEVIRRLEHTLAEGSEETKQPLRARVLALRNMKYLDEDGREERLLRIGTPFRLGLGLDRPTLPWERQADRFPLDVHSGFVALTLLSPFHFFALASFFFGMAVLVLAVAEGGKVVALLLTCAQVVLLAVLSQVRGLDVEASLVDEVYQLERAKVSVQKHLQDIQAFQANAANLDALWAHRTSPCLDLLGHLHNQLWETADQDRLALLSGASARLEPLLASLGPAATWLGQPTEAHRRAAQQLRDVTASLELVMDDEDAVPQTLNHLEYVAAWRCVEEVVP